MGSNAEAVAGAALGLGAAPAAAADRGEPKQDALFPAKGDAPMPPAPMTDGNGTPVREERYIRAAWQAFPPEAAHG